MKGVFQDVIYGAIANLHDTGIVNITIGNTHTRPDKTEWAERGLCVIHSAYISDWIQESFLQMAVNKRC